MYIDFTDGHGNAKTVRVDDRDVICLRGNIVWFTDEDGIYHEIPADQMGSIWRAQGGMEMERYTKMKQLLFDELDALIPDGTNYEDALKILREHATRERPFFSLFASTMYSFLSPSEEVVNIIADYFDGTYDASCVTGSYDVLEDLEEGVCDYYSGMYYVDVEGSHDDDD